MLDLSAKRARLQESLRFSPGRVGDAIQTYSDTAERATAAIWRREPLVWSTDPAVQQKIADRLGWMTSPSLMTEAVPRLLEFADRVKRDGFTDVVLLGMGGSSLAPETLRGVLGVAPGWPRFHVLDSTDPAAVIAASTPPRTTLYVLASKSGTTIEPNSMAAYFRRRLEESSVPRWADHFVAITDAGTELERRAHADGFRELFINPSDIGGRYSAVSFFGLVPAALMGLHLAVMIEWAQAMLTAAEPGFGTAATNPAVALGLAMGAAARGGRDKLTLIMPPALEPFGLWVEQLVAESTGKNSTGTVPIAGEPLADPATYGTDRLFVRIRLHGSFEEELRDGRMTDLKATGAPVVEIDLAEPSALGAEFVRWEIATAVAGAILRINPFDEPNVQQAKDATRAILQSYKANHELATATPDRMLRGEIALTLSAAARETLHGQGADALLTLLRQGDYFGLLAYVGPDPELAAVLHEFRHAVRDRTGAATMFGYGPRYLHSTGQLHKGGPNTGVFLLITAAPRQDVPIPGEQFSFGTLEQAQALGDFASLGAEGRRALHAHLPAPDRPLLRELTDALLGRLRPDSARRST
jgi:glucose-6-phosphate isomerase